jgi:SPP1 family predicted phage head-tail adaptor
VIGELSNPIAVEKTQKISDGMGGASELEWVVFKKVWASIAPVSASQSFFAQHLEHRITHKVTIRYLPGVSSDMRINFKGRFLQIRSIKNLKEENKFMELMCEEGAAS